MAGMERVKLITSFICCIVWHSASATLTVTPRDTESKVYNLTYFNCSTDILSKEIHWSHGSNYVYAGGLFYEPYLDRFKIEINNSTGAYNLVIPSVEPRDAGEYFCQDDGGHGKQTVAAKLIVLADDPTCHPNVIEDGNSCVINPDEVHLSCSVGYHGNISPQLEWSEAGENSSLANVTRVLSSNSTTYSVTLKADLSTSYVCQTTRSVTSQYKCNTGTIRSQYVFSGKAKVNITADEEVKCSANSSQTCSYKWIWFNGSDSMTVSTDQTLKPTKVGSHRCEATCRIGNKYCTVDVMVVEVISIESSEATTGQNWSLLLLLLLVILPIILVIVVAVVFLCRRHRRATKRTSMSQELQANETDQSAVPFMTEEVTRSHAESNKDLEEEVKANKTDLSTASLLKAEDKEQKKQSHEPNGGHKEDVAAVKTEQPKAAEDKKEVTQSHVERNKKDPKGLSLLEGKPQIVSVINREENKEKYITGVTVLKDMLFIATGNSPTVEVYNVIKTFQLIRRLPITEVKKLFDIACCHLNDYVFISGSEVETESNVIVRSNPTLTVDKRWSTGDDFGNLSVSSESNIILCVSYKSILIEYTNDGEKIRVITLPDLVHPLHAIKLTSGEFLVSHGRKDDALHRVCNVNEGGEVVKSFGGEKGSSVQHLNEPNYFIVDEEDSILVVDSSNKRLLLLDSDLKVKREFLTEYNAVLNPGKLCLCQATRNLFVVDSKYQVLIFSVK